MRISILMLILIATVFGSGFWYDTLHTPCKVPVRYYIGNVDTRFGTNEDELNRITQNAEALWETRLNTDLFIHDEANGTLPINFIFDERQAEADKEAELRADLKAKEGMSENVASQYQTLITEFRTKRKEYESRVVAYEAKLQKYNTEVNRWNEKGGAPEDVVGELRTRANALETEKNALTALALKLNTIADGLNRIGARGNELITDYNAIVNEYNEEFSTEREFAQGDYTGDAINIYQFDSEEELTIVLAHELGHALSLDHVEGEKSLMYHLMGVQTTKAGIQNEDIAEYTRICTERSLPDRFLRMVASFL